MISCGRGNPAGINGRGRPSLTYKLGAPGCRLTNSTTQSMSSGGGWVVVTFNTEDHDFGGMHSTTTNTGRITIPAGWPGYYLFCAGGLGADVGDEDGLHFAIVKNNTNIDYMVVGDGPETQHGYAFSKVANAVAGDYFEFQTVQVNTFTMSGQFFSAQWIGF